MKVSRFWLYAFVVLLLNSAYLWPFAEPTLFYLGNLILHMLLGLVLTAACLVYLFRHFKSLSFAMRLGLILFLLSAVPGNSVDESGRHATEPLVAAYAHRDGDSGCHSFGCGRFERSPER